VLLSTNCEKMSSAKWERVNGVKYPVDEVQEGVHPERKVLPWAYSVSKDTFVHQGSEWVEVMNITLEEAIAIRQVERARKRELAGSGQVVDYDDEGWILKWCKVTNWLFEPLDAMDEVPRMSVDSSVSSAYSEKLNAVCVGTMINVDGKWQPDGTE
jgi:hypothetical protein